MVGLLVFLHLISFFLPLLLLKEEVLPLLGQFTFFFDMRLLVCLQSLLTLFGKFSSQPLDLLFAVFNQLFFELFDFLFLLDPFLLFLDKLLFLTLNGHLLYFHSFFLLA